MQLFLIKRILFVLPSLWLIVTLVFLLSRLLPGSFGAESILKEGGSFYSTGESGSRERAYAEFLHKTGQDLPLFYFSLTSAAEPDKALAALPPHERLFLQKMHWTYGSSSLVTAYYQQVKALEQNPGNLQEHEIQAIVRKLYTSTAPEVLQEAAGAAATQTSAAALKRAAAALVQERQPYAVLLPELHWHGTRNQYHRWLAQLLQGSLGNSFRDNRAVGGIIAEAIQTTLAILLISMVITTLLALEISIFLIRSSGRRWRRVILPFLFLTDRIPVFLLATLLLVLLASPDYLQLFPVYGLGYYTGTETAWWYRTYYHSRFLVLPVICLIVANLPYLSTQFYNAMADISRAEFIKTARAKGLAEDAIIRKHILRNTLLPVITLLSDFIPALVAGAVVVETIFAIPGIGSLLVQAVQARDYPVMVGIVLVVASAKIIANLLADLLYSLADPRIRLAAS